MNSSKETFPYVIFHYTEANTISLEMQIKQMNFSNVEILLVM